MNSTEEYLDQLLKSVTGEAAFVEPMDISADLDPGAIGDIPAEATEATLEETMEASVGDSVMPEGIDDIMPESMPETVDIPVDVDLSGAADMPEVSMDMPADLDIGAIGDIPAETTEATLEETMDIPADLDLDGAADMPGEIPEILDDELPDIPAEEMPMEDEDISNLLKSIEEMGDPSDVAMEVESEILAEQDAMLSSDTMDQQGDTGAADDTLSMGEGVALDDLDGLIAGDGIGAEEPVVDPNADLSDLLAGMSDDAELSEIGDLLNKDENNELVDEVADFTNTEMSDDEMFNIDEVISEDEMDEEGGKKKKKKKKKEKKDKEPKEKKPNFFTKLFATLTEEAEEDEEEEPAAVFAEETAVDIAVEGAADNEKILEEMDEEGEEKGKKGKKGKKDKAEKEADKKAKAAAKAAKKAEKAAKREAEAKIPQKKLPRKKVIAICLLCFSLGVVMTLLAYVLPYSIDTGKAVTAYQYQNYEDTYQLLKGHKLNKEEQLMYDRTVVLLKEERKYDA